VKDFSLSPSPFKKQTLISKELTSNPTNNFMGLASFRFRIIGTWFLDAPGCPSCERRSATSGMRTILGSKAALGYYHPDSILKVYSLRVGRTVRTLGNSLFMQLNPQGGKELSQMILQPL